MHIVSRCVLVSLVFDLAEVWKHMKESDDRPGRSCEGSRRWWEGITWCRVWFLQSHLVLSPLYPGSLLVLGLPVPVWPGERRDPASQMVVTGKVRRVLFCVKDSGYADHRTCGRWF